ncbi:MAG: hypothetical protein WA840_15370 [Caulobacteraceae bacterium]
MKRLLLPSPFLARAASGLVRRLPCALSRTARRRRALLMLLCAPGFICVVALPLHRQLWPVVVGVLSILCACGLRRFSEPSLSGDPHHD